MSLFGSKDSFIFKIVLLERFDCLGKLDLICAFIIDIKQELLITYFFYFRLTTAMTLTLFYLDKFHEIENYSTLPRFVYKTVYIFNFTFWQFIRPQTRVAIRPSNRLFIRGPCKWPSIRTIGFANDLL